MALGDIGGIGFGGGSPVNYPQRGGGGGNSWATLGRQVDQFRTQIPQLQPGYGGGGMQQMPLPPGMMPDMNPMMGGGYGAMPFDPARVGAPGNQFGPGGMGGKGGPNSMAQPFGGGGFSNPFQGGMGGGMGGNLGLLNILRQLFGGGLGGAFGGIQPTSNPNQFNPNPGSPLFTPPGASATPMYGTPNMFNPNPGSQLFTPPGAQAGPYGGGNLEQFNPNPGSPFWTPGG